MKYPEILSEERTIELMLEGASISRYGDGEWRCAAGSACTSQRAEKGISAELQNVLLSPSQDFLVGIPNVFKSPRKESWLKYAENPYLAMLLPQTVYASSFITRPDSAPWIDTPTYWHKVEQLWKDQNIVLIVGHERDDPSKPEQKSLTAEMLSSARRITTIIGPRQHAYAQIDEIEKHAVKAIQTFEGDCRVLMCLGTAATCLAYRLHRRGAHALDVGHMGMFMRHAGAYRYSENDVASSKYRSQLEQLHKSQSWGADGAKHAKVVEGIAANMNALTILDYGCGEMKLAEALKPRRVSGYDPGIPERRSMQKPCDLVVCTDVLEHVEPEKIDAVIDHIYSLSARRAYFVISLKLANAKLPDGRNAHLIVESAQWWRDKLKDQGFIIIEEFETSKEYRAEVGKP